MALKTHLLDSNAIIDYIGGILPAKTLDWLDSIVGSAAAISVINQIEVLSFDPADPNDLAPFEELVETVEVLPLDNSIVKLTIEIRRKYKLKLPDAVIAATALSFDLTLVSRNEKDFGRIPGLKLFNPHK